MRVKRHWQRLSFLAQGLNPELKVLPIIPWILIALFIRCKPANLNPVNPDGLKFAISQSIETPFTAHDTIIYHSFIGICGNSSEEELQRYYEPQLTEQVYQDIIQENNDLIVLYTDAKLFELIDSVCFDHPEDKWECFIKNKIDLSVTGWVKSPQEINLYEHYTLNGEHIQIHKTFKFRNDDWIMLTKKTKKY